MWNMSSTRRGGGDHPLDNILRFKYRFRSSPKYLLAPYRVKFVIPFDVTTEWHPEGTSGILQRAPFAIRDRNIMEWARECITENQASFEFKVDLGLNFYFTKKRQTELTAKFGDPKHATMFKLSFLGNF
jgi:hypothetical protein